MSNLVHVISYQNVYMTCNPYRRKNHDVLLEELFNKMAITFNLKNNGGGTSRNMGSVEPGFAFHS